MSESCRGRMLLSHNFAINQADVPRLSQDEFVQVIADGLKDGYHLACNSIENPHWMVEVLFDPVVRSPQQVGQVCAQALLEYRSAHKSIHLPSFQILMLGGLKTSATLNTAPTSLQLGEWGVDVVETPAADQFLQELGWEAVVATKAPDSIFQVTLTCPAVTFCG